MPVIFLTQACSYAHVKGDCSGDGWWNARWWFMTTDAVLMEHKLAQFDVRLVALMGSGLLWLCGLGGLCALAYRGKGSEQDDEGGPR